MTWWDLPQYLGVVLGLLGALFVSGSTSEARRRGFAIWIFSNIFLISWALHAQAWGLIVLYVIYCWTSVRGFRTNRPSAPTVAA